MYENSFIQSKTEGVGWIGASDAAVEGDWRWVTGPEGLNGGLFFWKGTGYQAKMNNPPGVYGPVNGAYHNWNRWDQGFSSSLPPGTWEPNQSGDEDYAHITYFPNNANDSFKWNDLPNGGGEGDYVPAGYLIEFGGMPLDPKVYLSATLDLQVNTMFFVNRGIQAAICEGDSVVLNKADTTHAVYIWTPADGSLSSLIIASPTAKPKVTSTYFVTGTRGVCTDTATYKVIVNPKPIVSLGPDTTICNPANIKLTPGAQFASYQWLPNGETTSSITVTKNGDYSVSVTDVPRCKASAGIIVSFTDKPKIDFSRLNLLVCGKKTDVLDITSDKGSFTIERLSDGFIFNNLNVAVPAFGPYDLKIKATDQFSCYSDSVVKIGFYKTPTVRFDFDSTTCKGYNLPARYSGDADSIVSNFKWVFGGEVIADTTGRNFLVVPLGINRSQRDLSLTVTQDGCSNTFTQKNIKVIPKLSLSIADNLGCEPFNADFKASNTEVVKYLWNFGDTSSTTEGDSIASHLYQKAGFYDVKLKVTTIVTSGDGCTNEIKIDSMVHVAPIPDLAFSLLPNVCLEPGVNEISYAGAIGTSRDKYYWDLSKFDPSEIVNNPQQTQGPFKFDLKTKPAATIGLKLTSEFGCESLPGNILVKRKPDFSIQSDLLAGCIPFEPTLSGLINVNDLVDKVNFNWDFGDGATGSGSPITHAYTDPGKNYTLILSGKSSLTGCENVANEPDFLKTNPTPKASFSMDHEIVYNDKPTVAFT
ncbi:MAG TPA: PKD domain-containing protein, partial [Prolixibacteraceae bacterium]